MGFQKRIWISGLIIALTVLIGVQISSAQTRVLKNFLFATPETLSSDKPVWQGGTIASISNGGIQIGEQNYPFSEDIVFYDELGNETGLGSFIKGSEIIYVLSVDRNSVIMLVNTTEEEYAAN